MKSPSSQSSPTPAILSLATSVPSHRYAQEEIYKLACRWSDYYGNPRVRQVFMNSDIDFRHLYLDMNEFEASEQADAMHERFRAGAIDLGRCAIAECLVNGGFNPGDIDCIIVATCTGYLCPGLSSIFVRDLGLNTTIQRADLVGMGCAGALPALQRAYDFVKAYPGKRALVVTVEICSACYYLDETLETIVGNAICGDGAAAVLVGMSDARSAPKIVGFETHLEPAYLGSVGLEQRDGRLRMILSKDIRDLAGALANTLTTRILNAYKLSKKDIAHWIIHSGGRKVIDNIQQEIGLTDDDVANTRHVLRNFGNMSSPTVLFVLERLLTETQNNRAPRSGDLGIMLALGPGLAVEGALLEW